MLSTLAATTVAAHWVGPWGAGFGFLFLLIPLFWITVFVLIFTFAGRRWRRAAMARDGYGYGYGPRSASRSAESTLAERFAKGDIDEVEYRARLEVIRANRENQG
ncbi:SHOCT domain-containing protein [Leifsonia poae]|uniref:SHOCT domain-containing protein n=1 Tax=Leifsonia poae TaxID=110933 RepID=UPI003D665626